MTNFPVSVSTQRAMAPQSATRSRVPGFIGFPLAVTLALGTSAGLYSAAAELTGFELSTVSRTLNEPWQIFALVAWRIAELYTFWVSGFDCEFLPSHTISVWNTDSQQHGTSHLSLC